MVKAKAKSLMEIFVLMAVLQGAKLLLETLISPYIPATRFWDKMLTMGVMLLLTGAVILYARHRKTALSLMPQSFSKPYIVFSAIAAALFIATPTNYIQGLRAVMVLIYGSIVTPVYEELLFRGYIWNRLVSGGKGRYSVYILSSLLFGLWHLGYMIPQLMDGNLFAVTTKIAAGLVYGFILGAVRLKTKNCYSTILLHGVMNLFAF